MQIEKLDHVNLRTTRLEEMIIWYRDVLGMTVGSRPNFGFPGAWLYAGDSAYVHLVGITDNEAIGSETDLKLEHFAFTARGADVFEAKLHKLNLPFRKTNVQDTNMVAFNIWDPDGNHIHVDFSLSE